MQGLFFYLFGTVAVLSALLTITRRDPVTSAFWLIFCFLNVAALFATLNAHFVAVLQILIYAGAIMVFFLFVTMFLGKAQRASERPSPLVFGVGVITVAAIAGGLMRLVRGGQHSFVEVGEAYGSIEAVSRLLLEKYIFTFELTGLLLTVAVIGAVMLARREAAGARATNTPAGAPAGATTAKEVADA
jgi:NADH-quinone oxidoreductase subunit J